MWWCHGCTVGSFQVLELPLSYPVGGWHLLPAAKTPLHGGGLQRSRGAERETRSSTQCIGFSIQSEPSSVARADELPTTRLRLAEKETYWFVPSNVVDE